MEKSMILELMNGKGYLERITLFKNEEYTKSLDEINKMLDTLCKGMTEEEKFEIIKKFYAEQGVVETVTADEYFKEGFKLGLILGAQNFLD